MKSIFLPPILPKTRELTFDFHSDVKNLINEFYFNQIFHEDDLDFISYQINHILDIYRQEAYDKYVYEEVNEMKFFIRILNYGINFNFVVMLKFGSKQYNIFYEHT